MIIYHGSVSIVEKPEFDKGKKYIDYGLGYLLGGNMDYRESITKQTEKELRDFLINHPQQELSYWDWRESNQLAFKAYRELEESTKGFGEEIDAVLKKYNAASARELSYLEISQINKELADIRVIGNTEIHHLLNELEHKTYSTKISVN